MPPTRLELKLDDGMLRDHAKMVENRQKSNQLTKVSIKPSDRDSPDVKNVKGNK
jgi:hypothetical protein